MEVLPCSDVRHVGESDCSKQESEAFKHDGISTDLKIDGLTLNVGESNEVKEDGVQYMLEGFPTSEGGSNGDAFYGLDIDDGQTLSPYSHDSEDENLETADHFAEPSCTEIKGLEQDVPQAVWVKVCYSLCSLLQNSIFCISMYIVILIN